MEHSQEKEPDTGVSAGAEKSRKEAAQTPSLDPSFPLLHPLALTCLGLGGDCGDLPPSGLSTLGCPAGQKADEHPHAHRLYKASGELDVGYTPAGETEVRCEEGLSVSEAEIVCGSKEKRQES